MRKTRFGIPAYEHVMALLFIAAVVGVFAYYALLMLEQAEAVVVRATITNMRSGMRSEMARRMIRGLPPLEAGGNPVRFLQIPPAGYLPGPSAALQAPVSGSWYYREEQDTLYYVPQYRLHLRLLTRSGDGPLGWRLMESSDTSKEIDLKSVTPYEWF